MVSHEHKSFFWAGMPKNAQFYGISFTKSYLKIQEKNIHTDVKLK